MNTSNDSSQEQNTSGSSAQTQDAVASAKPQDAGASAAKNLSIKVKTLTGREINLSITSSDKVIDIKNQIDGKEGIPPEQQRLIFSGRQMNDDITAEDAKLQGGSIIHLVLSLRGGN